jgi:competence protein ComEC
VAPAANLAAVPVSALLLAAAWLAVLADGAWPGTGRWLFHACTALAEGLDRVVAAAAALPATGWGARADGGVTLVAAAGAAALAWAALPPRGLATGPDPAREWRRTAAGCAGLAATAAVLLLVWLSPPRTPPAGTWWLVALDVGQGDATALAFADGWWLVDAGPRTPRWDAGEGAVLPFLRWAGVRRLERLVLTHADGDHTGGAAAVLRSLPVGAVLAPPSLTRLDAAPRTPWHVALGGDTLRSVPAVRALWPAPGGAAPAACGSADNAGSLVLEVGASRGRALLLADVDSTIERRLSAVPGPALLKVAHHGSGSSSGAVFLGGLAPGIAIVSCGRRNAFGHPAAGTLERLRACGTGIARTDRDGALWFELDARGARRLDWRRGGDRPPAPRGTTCAAPVPAR